MKRALSLLVAGLLATIPMGGRGMTAPAHSHDPMFTEDLQWGLFQIHAPEAWSVTRGRGAVIAIVDSGVDLTHPELRRKLIVLPGADQVDKDGRDGPEDEVGHGTYTAGIAAAITNNGIGIAGTAPEARIMPVRVLDETNSGTVDEIAAGIRFAADHGADVINLSLSGTAIVDTAYDIYYPVIPDAIDYAWKKGAVIVAAAGNTYVPYCASPGDKQNVICVGSTNRAGDHSLYSQSDGSMIKNFVVAPGGDNVNTGSCQSAFILSTWARDHLGTECSYPGGYEAHNGTSAAAPFVSGIAAMLVSLGLDNDQVVERLTQTTDDLGAPGRDPIFGFGRVNAARAVGAI